MSPTIFFKYLKIESPNFFGGCKLNIQFCFVVICWIAKCDHLKNLVNSFNLWNIWFYSYSKLIFTVQQNSRKSQTFWPSKFCPILLVISSLCFLTEFLHFERYFLIGIMVHALSSALMISRCKQELNGVKFDYYNWK